MICCYQSHRKLLESSQNTREVGKEYLVCYGSDPKNIESGDRLEVYGKYYDSPAPFTVFRQCCSDWG